MHLIEVFPDYVLSDVVREIRGTQFLDIFLHHEDPGRDRRPLALLCDREGD
ncbi:hypothetical protein [Leekyejoonella antrihumi]|uniref:hypothetical protein n=1 Tax=Leekyejoonella antrihumi TaxID=1660198 RepID=UPI001646766B|nr:hypothetical protein [Leekyejoonella antrihumi]